VYYNVKGLCLQARFGTLLELDERIPELLELIHIELQERIGIELHQPIDIELQGRIDIELYGPIHL
jgi:hypothetical protein